VARIYNATRGTLLAANARIARTPWERTIGLMGQSPAWCIEGNGLLIPGCRAIHTFFMRFPIDVIFVDRENTVAMRVPMKPGQRAACAEAASVIELPIGTIPKTDTRLNDRLEITG
jgi:uncharacterized protein